MDARPRGIALTGWPRTWVASRVLWRSEHAMQKHGTHGCWNVTDWITVVCICDSGSCLASVNNLGFPLSCGLTGANLSTSTVCM